MLNPFKQLLLNNLGVYQSNRKKELSKEKGWRLSIDSSSRPVEPQELFQDLSQQLKRSLNQCIHLYHKREVCLYINIFPSQSQCKIHKIGHVLDGRLEQKIREQQGIPLFGISWAVLHYTLSSLQIHGVIFRGFSSLRVFFLKNNF